LKHARVVVFLLFALGFADTVHSATNETLGWDGNRTVPVHRLPLVDEEGEEIVPTYRYEMPFSVRNTCGPCHDYSTISGGLHFNSAAENASAGRPGEPWVWVDEKTGTWLPLSYRGWSGAWKPHELGITPWRFTQVFGRHTPGGSVAEPQDVFADPEARWDVSGKVEINCLGCHNASPHQDQSEWAIQMSRENFRWAATAASGLGEVRGMASRVPNSWMVHNGPNPDDTQWAVPPWVRYDSDQFDSKRRTVFDVARSSPDARCLYCHSASPVGRRRWQVDDDVHSAAGLQCVDCHRNGLDHMMVRGYESEALERNDQTVAEFSCKGCHLGIDDTQNSAAVGRLGAIRPVHKGLPPVHLEKLACTVCHSGIWPGDKPDRVRMSRANRLGIYGKARWDTDAPYIAEPVFIKGPDGKLAPHRMMWPAFWARLEGDRVQPLVPDDVVQVATGILDAELQVARVLANVSVALAELADAAGDPTAEGDPVFVTAGRVYRGNVDGGLDVSDYTGEADVPNVFWGREKDGEVFPLVPDFDPTAEELDYEIESRILAILGVLALDETVQAEPVAALGNRIYRQTFDGLLQTLERTDGATDTLTWRWRQNDTVSPLVPEFVQRAVIETAGIEESFTEEQVAMALDALADDRLERTGRAGEFVYVSGGKMFRRGDTGTLVASDHPAAEPYYWPIAHNVRPASQSLGMTSCADCHAADAPFFFGIIEATGPLRTAEITATVAYELQEIDPTVTRLFGWTFRFRPLLKTVGFCASALVFAVLLLYGLAGLRVLCRRLGQREY